MLKIYVLLLILEFLIVCLVVFPQAEKWRKKFLQVGKSLLILASLFVIPLVLTFFVVDIVYILSEQKNIHRFLTGGIWPEVAGIVFTILVLDTRAANRAKNERKLALFRQAKSRSNDFALDALRQIREDGLWDKLLEHYRDKHGEINLDNVQWENAVLLDVSFKGVSLREANLENTHLLGSNFENAHLNNANLNRAELSGTIMSGADLSRAYLQGAKLNHANLEHANLYQTDLRGADLKNATFEDAQLVETNFQGTILWETNFQRTRLTLVNLQKANLWESNFCFAYLSECQLQGTNLKKSAFRNTTFEHVEFDVATVLPDSNTEDGMYISDNNWTPKTDMRRYTDPNHVDENGNPDFWEPDWVKKQREQKD